MSILNKFLTKLGVKSYTDLNDEERETFKEWEISLSGRKLTDEDVKNFLENELQIAISKLIEVNLSLEDEIFRRCEVKMIQKIINFLNSPRIEKEMVEKQLSSRL